MLDAVLKFILPHLQEAILFVLGLLFVFILRELRKLLYAFRDTMRKLVVSAKQTPSLADDARAAFALAVAEALTTSFDRYFPPTPAEKKGELPEQTVSYGPARGPAVVGRGPRP